MSSIEPPEVSPERFERELVEAVERQGVFGAADLEVRTEGTYPATEIVLTFKLNSPRGEPGRLYGWRQRIWPIDDPSPYEEALSSISVPLMEHLALGPIPTDAPPGAIQWI